MYAPPHRLDTPPPGSQFRRPWSPDPHDPFGTGNVNQFPRGDYDRWVNSGERRREPSDASVEALDLADYAMTFRQHTQPPAPAYASQPARPQSNIVGPYPPFQPTEPDYPPMPPSVRPLASYTTLSPPSLTSGGESSSQARSQRSYGPRTPSRRPYSLPPAPYSQSSFPPSGARRQVPYGADPRIQASQENFAGPQEIDIANFPAWSREWYNQQKGPPATSSNPYSPSYPDYDTPMSDLESNATHRYSANSHAAWSDASHRNLLPWSGDPQERPSIDLDPGTKEERMRMLEAEFGQESNTRGGRSKQYGQGEEIHKVGSIDEKGSLITDGPRKRAAVRVAQGLLALGAAVSAIYGALFIKPSSKPPPESSLAAFVLYGLSVITTLLILYLFVFRPCCCAGRRKPPGGMQGPGGMMVLPVHGLPGGKGKQKPKKGKKGQPHQQDVQVNLIVDPTMFNRQEEEEEEEEDEEVEAMPGMFPWSNETSSARPKPKRKRPHRRSVFAGLALEEQWLAARRFLRWITVFDSVFMVLWGATFVLILIGKRCPAGEFEGWCTTYNLATAAGCLLCVAFGFGLFFDIKDLHASRQSPRTRT